jgi:tetratricopeptide (TPR) repeat protein
MFSWFRSKPLTERELLNQERKEVSKKLQDPGHLQLKYAQWRESVGDLADARQSYQLALKDNPKSLEAKLGLARLDQLAGRSEDAEEGFQNALKSRPGDPQATNALGQFYASQKLWSKALPLLEEAADAAPNELTYRYHLAVAMAQSGDVNGAFPHFQEALGEAEAHYNIGFLLAEQGHKDMAKQRFQKALSINPGLMQAQMMLEELEPKVKDTQIAQAPVSPWPAAAPVIQQVSANEPAPYRVNVAPAPFPEPKTLQHVKPAGQLPPQTPSNPPVAQAIPQPVQHTPAPNPPAFRATRPKEWAATQAAHHAPAYLPPYQPNATTPTANSSATATTPPITPAQREQWENQMKANR